MDVRPEDIRFDVFRDAVRVTHVPTGIVGWADDGDSTEANHALALSRRLTDALNANEDGA